MVMHGFWHGRVVSVSSAVLSSDRRSADAGRTCAGILGSDKFHNSCSSRLWGASAIALGMAVLGLSFAPVVSGWHTEGVGENASGRWAIVARRASWAAASRWLALWSQRPDRGGGEMRLLAVASFLLSRPRRYDVFAWRRDHS